MPAIVLVSGSPAATSRSTAILKEVGALLAQRGVESSLISVRDFPAEDLIFARYDSPAFDAAKALIASAAGLVVITPIYKAAYTGTLKTFLDILPQLALRGKTVLPIASGGSNAHLLAIDYALKPVLSVLGATDLLQGVYAVDDQVKVSPAGELWLHDELRTRLEGAVEHLAIAVKRRLSAGAV
jgi:FMN reductase